MGNAATDPIVSTEAWTLRFDDHADIPVTINVHHGDCGVWYYAHSAWPGLDYELHRSWDTARGAVARLVETGMRNGEVLVGPRAVLAPGDVTEIARLTADRDAWRDALQHVACRLGGTGAGSPDDVRLACDDLAAQDDDLIAAGVDYQRERDELRALVREHFAAEAVICDVVERRARLYESPSFSPHESRELGRAHAAAVVRADAARAALTAKVTP